MESVIVTVVKNLSSLSEGMEFIQSWNLLIISFHTKNGGKTACYVEGVTKNDGVNFDF